MSPRHVRGRSRFARRMSWLDVALVVISRHVAHAGAADESAQWFTFLPRRLG